MKQFLCLSLCLALYLVGVTGLRCIPGEGCTAEVTAGLDCEFGFVADRCNRCECAKGLGEVCGGTWDFSGICAKGLECDRDGKFSEGVCVKKRRKNVKSK
ncbi:single insulin-like growth factor-binding domain protein-2 isoform X2 [Penaeus vannamei]|uniref:single insulin-like growth factor-binding domain protein-2 isoform X2 n=1 Tax=Penaeus vannamei TaxID=6689 RepID=UPI00387F7A47